MIIFDYTLGRVVMSAYKLLKKILLLPQKINRFRLMATSFLTLFLAIAYFYHSYLVPWRGSDEAFSLKAAEPQWIFLADTIEKSVPAGVKSLFIFDFSNDPNHDIVRVLRDRLALSQRFRLIDQTFGTKARTLVISASGAPQTAEQAVSFANKNNIDAVLLGRVDNLFSPSDDGSPSIQWRIVQARTGAILSEGTESVDSLLNESGQKTAIDYRWSLCWILFVILLPLITLKILGAITKKESNCANLVTLILYTLIEMSAYCLAIYPELKTPVGAAVFAVLTFLCFLYNAFIMSITLKMRS